MSSYDLAIAAAAAGGQDVVMEHGTRQYQRLPVDNCDELPSVDDLEVAAAAAAAALEVLAPAKQEESSEEESSDSDEDSDSDSDDDSDGDDDSGSDEEMQGSEQQACEQAITLQLLPAADGSDGTTLQLRINSASTDQPHKASTSSSSDSSSSDEESDDPAAASEEPLDYEDMAALITKAYQQADEEDLGGDELLQQHGCQVEMGLPPVAPLEEEIRAEEPLEVAGKVTALLEGMVVVQCPENGRALLEGSVLCLEDRSAVGRVEEVFGPVQQPMYALRYAGKGPPPAALAPGAVLFGVVRLCTYLNPHEIQKVPAVDVDESAAEAEEEVCFSDDEKEAEWRRSRGAGQGQKRKGEGAGGATEGGRARPRKAAGTPTGGRGGGPGRGRQPGPPAGPSPQHMQHMHMQQPGPPPAAFQAMAAAGQLSAMALHGAQQHMPAPPLARPQYAGHMGPQQPVPGMGYGNQQGRIMGPNGPMSAAAGAPAAAAAPPPQGLTMSGTIMGPGGYHRPAGPQGQMGMAPTMAGPQAYPGQGHYGQPGMGMQPGMQHGMQQRGGLMYAQQPGAPRPQAPVMYGAPQGMQQQWQQQAGPPGAPQYLHGGAQQQQQQQQQQGQQQMPGYQQQPTGYGAGPRY